MQKVNNFCTGQSVCNRKAEYLKGKWNHAFFTLLLPMHDEEKVRDVAFSVANKKDVVVTSV